MRITLGSVLQIAAVAVGVVRASSIGIAKHFAVWMALAKATPVASDGEAVQPEFRETPVAGEAGRQPVNDDPPQESDA